MDTTIERREFKYLTDETTAAALRAAVKPYCQRDRHGALRPDGRYLIASLYFDTPTLALYRANDQELMERFKLRVRSYPPDDEGPVFFEVKRRIHDAIVKSRGEVARERWVRLIERPEAAPPDGPAVERFLALVHAYQASPVVFVQYEREAWVSEIDAYARVTIDRNIRFQVHKQLSMTPDPRRWRNVDNPVQQQCLESMTVVELKFTRAVPRWMVSLVRSLDLVRGAFSKYATAVQSGIEAPGAWFLTPHRVLS